MRIRGSTDPDPGSAIAVQMCRFSSQTFVYLKKIGTKAFLNSEHQDDCFINFISDKVLDSDQGEPNRCGIVDRRMGIGEMGV
jgi:hypothetical protein